MIDKHNCEICEKDDEIKEANNKLDGVWMCIPCIEAYNTAAIKEVNKLKEEKELRKFSPPNSPVVLPSVSSGAESLLENLSFVMRGVMDGTINPQRAKAACDVSTEIIKLIELKWRMTKR